MASIIEKLQKLINHERSAREIGSIAEAQTFATKIQKLLAEHKLTMGEVEYQAQERANPIGDERIKVTRGKGMWSAFLAEIIARAYYCKVLRVVGEGSLIFVGRDTDRTAAVGTFQRLHRVALTLATSEAQKPESVKQIEAYGAAKYGIFYTAQDRGKAVRHWKKSYLLGFVQAVGERLRESTESVKERATTEGYGLILRDKAAIEEYARDKFEMGSARTSRQSYSAGAFEAGRRDGSSVSLKDRTALGSGA